MTPPSTGTTSRVSGLAVVERRIVVEAGPTIDLVEAKSTELPHDRDARGLIRLAAALEASGVHVQRQLVASRTAAPVPFARGVEAVHLCDVAERIAAVTPRRREPRAVAGRCG